MMKKHEKEVLQSRLDAEEKEMKHLKAIYNKAAEDITKKIEISNGKISVLLANWDDLTDEEKSVYQSQIYQRNFQQSLKNQIDDFMKDLNSKQYKSITDYMKDCYEKGFIGAMYSIHKQGIPLIMPLDQKKIIKAMFTDSKISKKLYTKLGEDVNLLKKRIANNLSRGIATASSYSDIARNIASASNVGFNKAMRIARTEGARVSNESAFDASKAAKDSGCDVVKMWSAALDGRTRPHHRDLDGQIRELDEPFEVAGMKVMYPSGFGRASEDINCRCALLQRAKWALDEDELETLKERAAYYGLDKTKDFNDYKKKYLKAADAVSVGVPKAAKAFTPANTVEDAKKKIEHIFKSTDFENLDEIDSELFIKTTNQLNKLESKFSIIEKQGATFSVNRKVFDGVEDAVAAVNEKELVNGVLKEVEMSINPKMYSDRDKLISSQRFSIEKGYLMQCSEEYMDVYSITHEYGHMLQDSITYKKFDSLIDEYKKIAKEQELLTVKLQAENISPAEKSKLFGEKLELNDLQEELQRKIDRFKSREEAALAKEINNEITHIAKDLMRERYDDFAGLSDDEISVTHYLSKYGQSTPFEFFAEVFANSQCGKPNILGEAMNMWLEKGGYIK